MTTNSSVDTRHNELKLEVEKLHSLEQKCLQGLANHEMNFQQNVTNKPESYEQQFAKTTRDAMVSTYSFLYLNNLKEEKTIELQGIEKRMQDLKKS
ncbi:uncharacterized protein CELE_F29C12.6 [Caenorhabditis elegans]|uniref:Uncharacterized protein n=1 Tax=Caenorhabditis elegans TaxID=6239 RepID=Q9XV49_CAEEL|nr:Uncharacterized protein CELE_F29C12.6 [Caenorhabditis elegans]CAB04219.1 Uncharacterized protein CELE_F29C12.6 [Caenorhabditis elegans]|eukprot:NP_496789.1 Uncharacterized protein CELE_F29C12.6 [Caenorhabditis elegans]